MPLPFDQGGLKHPGERGPGEITLEEYRRGLNSLVATTARDMTLDDELMVIESVLAMRNVNFDVSALQNMLSWALVRLAKVQVAQQEYDKALEAREHGAIAANRFLASVQEAMQP